MAEPKGTQTWLVDASACGQKGMHWRTHLGADKFITRPSDAKPGFAPNGERFRGVEEYRGWVKNVQTDRWLPIRDVPATGASEINDELHRRGIAPTGRGKQARDVSLKPIPYLHPAECECGGRWCKSPVVPEEPLPEAPRRRKPLEFVRPLAPTPPAPRPAPRRRGCVEWLWWQHAVGALLVLFLLMFVTAPELVLSVAEQLAPRFHFEFPTFVWASDASERGWSTARWSVPRAPPLHQALQRWFH